VVLLLAGSACSDDDGSAASLCAAVAEGDGITSTFQDFDPSDPEAALDQLRTARVTLGKLLDEAPNEVHDELQVEIDYVQALIDALEPVEPGDAAAAAVRVRAVTEAHPDVGEASATLAAYSARECTSS
jgi:hypothetical protein